ncbi:MAG: GNAT family N-acetyltransferase [Nitrospirota bacterium]|nr:MAG: GNAT family N-acetyltransferase [Nitrospirota bacterium]
MLENFSVREASWSDLEHLVEFNAAMALETEGKLLDKDRLRSGAEAVLSSPSRGVYVVGEYGEGPQERQVIGQLLITYEWSDWRNANFWWIQSVYVHPDWRNRGVFRAMYEFVLQQAETRADVCGIRLYVEQDNAQAIAVYDKLGLRPTPYRVIEVDFVFPTAV